MSAARLGAATAAVIFVLDQATKLWLLFVTRLPERGPIEATPFMELVTVWNRGISYGLFQQDSDFGRWALVAISGVAAVALGVWMLRTTDRVLAVSLGLIVGGAVGNGVDRAVYGAVFDFVHLHAWGYSWYVFNVADAAIVVGVAGLLYDALRPQPAHGGEVAP